MSFVDTVLGKRFGRLVVEEIISSDGRRVLKCRCDCGVIKIADPRMLKRGDTTSCGCLRKEHASARRSADLIGKRFGRLLVESAGTDIPRGKRGLLNKGWICKCDCGKISHLTSNALLSGNTNSCGCFNRDQTAKARPKGKYQTAINSMRSKAEIRQISWTLMDTDAVALIKQDCHYCGAVPRVTSKCSLPINGLDRKDSNQGYVLDNVVPCCSKCNFMKHVMSYDEYIAHLQITTKHLKLGAS